MLSNPFELLTRIPWTWVATYPYELWSILYHSTGLKPSAPSAWKCGIFFSSFLSCAWIFCNRGKGPSSSKSNSERNESGETSCDFDFWLCLDGPCLGEAWRRALLRSFSWATVNYNGLKRLDPKLYQALLHIVHKRHSKLQLCSSTS